MEELDKRRATELVERLRTAEGVGADSTGELFVVSYPKEELGQLLGFNKKDLERAIELKLLGKASILKVNGVECQVYMKTVNAAKED